MLSKPHEYWRWLDHTATYTDFKKEMWDQWQSYRTRKDPNIELSAKYEYADAGTYKVVVKVIDILGNDTTKTLDIKVK